MSEANKAVIRRLVEEAEEKGNLAVLDEIVADDFVDHTPLPGLPPTIDGVKALFAGLQEGFSNLRIEIAEQLADGDKVATRKRFRGTHSGPFLGIPASGKALDLEVIDILTVRDGKIRDHRVVLDQLTLLRQLGAMPE